jgi:SAM-dependent methyltransferase
MIEDYYQIRYKAYHKKTFLVDPESFLAPLAARLKPGATVLDVGCGSGRDLLWLKNRGFEVTGFERSVPLARLAKETTGGRIVVADFETYDFSRLSMDAILMVGALVHLPGNRVPAVLNSIASALKANGKMLLTLKKGAGPATDPHGRVFTLWRDNDLRKMFERLELDVVDFFQQSSNTGSGEIWLGYVLEKAG